MTLEPLLSKRSAGPALKFCTLPLPSFNSTDRAKLKNQVENRGLLLLTNPLIRYRMLCVDLYRSVHLDYNTGGDVDHVLRLSTQRLAV